MLAKACATALVLVLPFTVKVPPCIWRMELPLTMLLAVPPLTKFRFSVPAPTVSGPVKVFDPVVGARVSVPPPTLLRPELTELPKAVA